MKKKRVANIVMVAVIAVIVIAGVFAVGHVRGWFEKPGAAAQLCNVKGIVSVERDGVAFNVSEDTVLRAGDKINLAKAASARISAEDGYLVLGENSSAVINQPDGRGFSASISSGEAFACAKSDAMDISLGDKKISLKNAVSALSVRTGAQTLMVLLGEAEGAKQGQYKEWIGTEESVKEIDINSLNDFYIRQIREANKDTALCFSDADLDELQAVRLAKAEAEAEEMKRIAEAEAAAKAEAERKAAEEAAKRQAEEEAAKKAAEEAEAARKAAEEAAARAKAEAERKAAEEAAAKAAAEKKAAEEAVAKAEAERKAAEEAAAKAEAERKAAEEAAALEAAKPHCTITIRCDTILNNWDNFDQAKSGYVPENGVILWKYSVAFDEGQSVLDVLKKACKARGILLEFSWSPMYGSSYVEGINNIYEFDCGPESGWLYKVNGWFPNYGCDNYKLADGDDIVWVYSCVGLGSDVGASL